jgi:hypothetical protein
MIVKKTKWLNNGLSESGQLKIGQKDCHLSRWQGDLFSV